MNAIILRGMTWAVVLGLALSGPGLPVAWAQIEITPEIREAVQQFGPELREIALTEIVPAIEAEPEGPEATVVETTAAAIHEVTETTKQALTNHVSITDTTVAALTANGVPAEVAATVETQLKDALAKASSELAKGGTLADAEKYFQDCKNALEMCKTYVGGDFEKVFGSLEGQREFGVGMLERIATTESNVNMADACMKEYFAQELTEAAFRTGGPEGGLPPREVLEQMAACGINPAEVFHGDFERYGPSPEALASMSDHDKVMYETWKSGDMAKMQEFAMHDSRVAMEQYGMTTEQVASMETHMMEMATMEATYREATTSTSDTPRTESAGTAEATHTTNSITATHDHNSDGHFEHIHYSDGTTATTGT